MFVYFQWFDEIYFYLFQKRKRKTKIFENEDRLYSVCHERDKKKTKTCEKGKIQKFYVNP